MTKKLISVCVISIALLCTSLLQAQTSELSKIVDAFSKTIKDNPGDSNPGDLTMKVLGNITGGNGVSAADSTAAIKRFMSARGGRGVHYEYITTITTKQQGTSNDTSNMYFNENGEGRSEMNLPSMMGVKGRNTLTFLAHIDQRRYSLLLDAAEKTYSLNVIDSSLANGSNGRYQVTKMGTETIHGYNCSHAKVVSTIGSGMFSSSTTFEVWTSTAVPGYSYIQAAMVRGITPNMMEALNKAGCAGFYVKMISQEKDYSMTMMLANVQQENFPSSLFLIPSGYRQSNQNMFYHMMGAKK